MPTKAGLLKINPYLCTRNLRRKVQDVNIEIVVF